MRRVVESDLHMYIKHAAQGEGEDRGGAPTPWYYLRRQCHLHADARGANNLGGIRKSTRGLSSPASPAITPLSEGGEVSCVGVAATDPDADGQWGC